MKQLKQYLIQFAGLSLGNHPFEFEADDKFFECFEHSEVRHGNIQIHVDLEKKANMLELDISFSGNVELECDVCTGLYAQPIRGEERLIVKFGEESYDETDEIIVLHPGEYEINIAQPLYEFIHLALPARRVHPEGECDPEVLKKLEELNSGEEEKDDTDPRWDALKGLNLN